jgi:hypothetical protein
MGIGRRAASAAFRAASACSLALRAASAASRWSARRNSHRLPALRTGLASSFIPRSSAQMHSPQGRHKLGGT